MTDRPPSILVTILIIALVALVILIIAPEPRRIGTALMRVPSEPKGHP